MILRARHVLLLALAVYVLVLVTTLPAALVWHHAAPAQARASGIEGTLWRGQASTVLVDGVRMSGLRWTFQPLELLRARLSFRVDTRLDDGFARAQVAVSPGGGRVLLRDLQAGMALQPLARSAGYRGVAGQLTLNLARLQLVDGWPASAEGRIGLGQLRISDLGAEPLGDFEFVMLAPERVGTLRAEVRDLGGPLQVQALANLAPDRSFELQGVVAARAEAAESLRQVLELLGPADPQRGGHIFGIAGKL